MDIIYVALGLQCSKIHFAASLTQNVTPPFVKLNTRYSVAKALNRPAVDVSASASVHLEQPKIATRDGDGGSFGHVGLLYLTNSPMPGAALSHTLCLPYT